MDLVDPVADHGRDAVGPGLEEGQPSSQLSLSGGERLERGERDLFVLREQHQPSARGALQLQGPKDHIARFAPRLDPETGHGEHGLDRSRPADVEVPPSSESPGALRDAQVGGVHRTRRIDGDRPKARRDPHSDRARLRVGFGPEAPVVVGQDVSVAQSAEGLPVGTPLHHPHAVTPPSALHSKERPVRADREPPGRNGLRQVSARVTGRVQARGGRVEGGAEITSGGLYGSSPAADHHAVALLDDPRDGPSRPQAGVAEEP